MTEPKLAAYAVTLVFGAGPIFVNTLVAHSPEEATARLLHQVMREKVPAEDLTGVAALPLDAEWLRFALRSIETGKAEGQVLSIVQPPPEAVAKPTLTVAQKALSDAFFGEPPRPPPRMERVPRMPTDPDDAAWHSGPPWSQTPPRMPTDPDDAA